MCSALNGPDWCSTITSTILFMVQDTHCAPRTCWLLTDVALLPILVCLWYRTLIVHRVPAGSWLMWHYYQYYSVYGTGHALCTAYLLAPDWCSTITSTILFMVQDTHCAPRTCWLLTDVALLPVLFCLWYRTRIVHCVPAGSWLM